MDKEKFLDLEHQHSQLLNTLEDLKETDSDQCFRALKLAKQQHQGQNRQGGGAYIIHPIRSALIVPRELDLDDPDLISALLLHDVAEDGTISIEGLQDKFKSELVRLVKGVHRSRSADESEEEKRRSKLEKIRKVAGKDKKIRIVALCDVLDNMRAATYLPEGHSIREKFPRWRNELKHWLPIADSTHPVLAQELASVLGKLD